MKIEEEKFGENCKLFTVDNGKISFSVTDLGCTITNLFVPNKNGEMTDVLLGYDDFDGWKKGTEAHNALVGRFANRIANAKFILNKKEYKLDMNSGKNCLHSGKNRFEKMIWNAKKIEEANKIGIQFSRISKSMEQGFPCDVEIFIEYFLLKGESEIHLEYKAKVLDENGSTPINLTNHAYFNLNGVVGNNKKLDDVLNHEMQLSSEFILEVNENMIPTGKMISVKNTEFDFENKKSVGKDISKIPESFGNGYDHCFVTKAEEKDVVFFGKISSPKTGIQMEILTNQRGVQIYTGNYLFGVIGKGGIVHKKYDGICFETQRFPDCINQLNFPSCVLHFGEEYISKTIYKFNVVL